MNLQTIITQLTSPFKILLDFVSLIVNTIFRGLIIWKSLFPTRELPKINFSGVRIINMIFLIIIPPLFIGCNNDDDTVHVPENKQVTLKITGKGTVLGQTKTFPHPKTGETIEALCFLMDLIDSETGNIIGTLQDCVVESIYYGDGTYTSKVITSINIDGRGSIQSESEVLHTMQPPVPDFKTIVFTTTCTPTKNNIVDTTFEFENMEGTVSLDGEVKIGLGKDIVAYNNNFTINMKKN
ncbi:hypothetical protein [Flavivirga eckloniae]|uniref:Uncharacterized protein n=1 Tax=Flavivirga eckloniae TaxID=1803846 RepID=A0A2K9PL37_9FLAO|nr:hypothetical protein [Flavivirga eckloniae]AUP77789.1 hypothetical protein C1H87_03280 [Flavivirga eckloniae]